MSATNCANTYEQLYTSELASIPPAWLREESLGATLTPKHVYDAFTVLCLLEYHHGRNEFLRVPHGGLQKDRYTEAIRRRNLSIRAYGQPEIRHQCAKCVRMYQGPEDAEPSKFSNVLVKLQSSDMFFTGRVMMHVIDGNAMGRPKCAVHNCKVPLDSNRDKFCIDHLSLRDICCIVGCEERVVKGKLTCSLDEHCAAEAKHIARGQAQFVLMERLRRARDAHPDNSLPTELSAEPSLSEQAVDDQTGPEEFDIDGLDADSRPDEALVGGGLKRRLRTLFTRVRTHNEQIIVAPCGVIIARETFYSAEAISSVAVRQTYCILQYVTDFLLKEMIRNTYPDPAFRPNHIAFDNNCSLKKHVDRLNDPFFDGIGLSVDVFHFTSKHTLTDTFCQQHCNPWAYPELQGEGEVGWYFNTSIAEQTNVWLGGYHSMCREMTGDRFDFFLDEMIIQRNILTIQRLQKAGASPSYCTVSY